MQKELAFGENSASGFEMAEWNRWKNNVSMDILVLNERVSVLEKKIVDMNSCASISTSDKTRSEKNHNIDPVPALISSSVGKNEITANWKDTATFADADNQGMGYLATVSRVIRSKKHARFQVILLIVCVVTFVWYGSTTFMSAMRNEKSEFKPSFKQYAVNYADSDEHLLYEMPYLFLRFIISFDSNSQYVNNKNKLLSDISDSQHNFEDRVIVSYEGKGNLYPDVSLQSSIENEMGDWNSLIVGFRMTVGEIPANGVFWIIALLDIQSIVLGCNVTIEHINLIIDRELLPSRVPVVIDQYTIDDDEFDVFAIGYTEMFTQKYRSKKSYSDIDMSWSQTTAPVQYAKAIYNITVEPSYIMFHIKPNMEVDHWKEYVTFGYSDWVTGMGGLFSLMVAGFMWASFSIAVRCGDGVSMGILPGLSYNFFSYEEILWIKKKLGSSGVI